MEAGKGFDLDRLQDERNQSCLPQMPDHAAFIAAGCLDADAGDTGLAQLGDKTPPAGRIVLNLSAAGTPMNGDVEFGLGRIDSGRRCVSLAHLRRPLPCEANLEFRQPSGSDEGAGAIKLRGSHKLLRVGTIRPPAALPPARTCGRAFLSERPETNCSRYYKGGQRHVAHVLLATWARRHRADPDAPSPGGRGL